jgi:redox-sensitive bicupin YhaK (pirin superfamily)
VSIDAETPTKLLFLSGQPLGEPVVAHGPFVMNTGPEIYQAIKDYQTGKMGHLD